MYVHLRVTKRKKVSRPMLSLDWFDHDSLCIIITIIICDGRRIECDVVRIHLTRFVTSYTRRPPFFSSSPSTNYSNRIDPLCLCVSPHSLLSLSINQSIHHDGRSRRHDSFQSPSPTKSQVVGQHQFASTIYFCCIFCTGIGWIRQACHYEGVDCEQWSGGGQGDSIDPSMGL